MKKQEELNKATMQPELKHDTMEYAASTDGDDPMDIPDEEEEITAGELDDLEEEDADDEAFALNAAETDSQQDVDNFLTSPDEIDELEEDDLDEEDVEPRR